MQKLHSLPPQTIHKWPQSMSSSILEFFVPLLLLLFLPLCFRTTILFIFCAFFPYYFFLFTPLAPTHRSIYVRCVFINLKSNPIYRCIGFSKMYVYLLLLLVLYYYYSHSLTILFGFSLFRIGQVLFVRMILFHVSLRKK